MIEVNKVSFSYGGNKPKVFNELSLRLEKGGIYGLLGKNGAGKSTLLYMISGLLRPQRGKVFFNDSLMSKRLPEALSQMFLMPEEPQFPAMTLKQFVSINKGFYPRFSDEILRNSLNTFDMPQKLNLKALSMGQKKKVYLCFALATNTPLLILDEPSNGLDIPAKNQFRQAISNAMSDDKMVLLSTHQVSDVESLLNYVTILDQSEMVLNEPMERIASTLRFERHKADDPISSNALYTLPTNTGSDVLFANTTGNQSEVNLELLFQAMLDEKEKIQKLFTNK